MIEMGDDFSIRELARRSGYTAPTIYHYFGDKDGLVDTLLEERFARLLEQVRRVEPGPDPVENLRALARTFVAFGLRNPTFYRLLAATSPNGPDRTPPSADAARAIMEKPFAELAKAGRLWGDVEVSLQSLWALLHGLTSLLITRPTYEWSEDLDDVAIDAMLRGLVRE